MLVRKRSYKIRAMRLLNGCVVINKFENREMYERVRSLLGWDFYYLSFVDLRALSGCSFFWDALSEGKIYQVSDAENIVVVGLEGEAWLLSESSFKELHRLPDGCIIDVVPAGLCEYVTVVGEPMKSVMAENGGTLRTKWGNLHHYRKGDFIISKLDDPEDKWVVNRGIFFRTYEVLGD